MSFKADQQQLLSNINKPVWEIVLGNINGVQNVKDFKALIGNAHPYQFFIKSLWQRALNKSDDAAKQAVAEAYFNKLQAFGPQLEKGQKVDLKADLKRVFKKASDEAAIGVTRNEWQDRARQQEGSQAKGSTPYVHLVGVLTDNKVLLYALREQGLLSELSQEDQSVVLYNTVMKMDELCNHSLEENKNFIANDAINKRDYEYVHNKINTPGVQQRIADFLNDPILESLKRKGESNQAQVAIARIEDHIDKLPNDDPLKAWMNFMLKDKGFVQYILAQENNIFKEVDLEKCNLLRATHALPLKTIKKVKDKSSLKADYHNAKIRVAYFLNNPALKIGQIESDTEMQAPVAQTRLRSYIDTLKDNDPVKPFMKQILEDPTFFKECIKKENNLFKDVNPEKIALIKVAHKLISYEKNVSNPRPQSQAAAQRPRSTKLTSTMDIKTSEHSIGEGAITGGVIGAVIGGVIGFLAGLALGGIGALATVPAGVILGSAIGAGVGAGIQWVRNQVSVTAVLKSILSVARKDKQSSKASVYEMQDMRQPGKDTLEDATLLETTVTHQSSSPLSARAKETAMGKSNANLAATASAANPDLTKTDPESEDTNTKNFSSGSYKSTGTRGR